MFGRSNPFLDLFGMIHQNTGMPNPDLFPGYDIKDVREILLKQSKLSSAARKSILSRFNRTMVPTAIQNDCIHCKSHIDVNGIEYPWACSKLGRCKKNCEYYRSTEDNLQQDQN